MASPLEILKSAKVDKGGCICKLISKAFTTRNLLHFAHLSTNSYAAHEALRDMYDDIIEKIDDIAEVYQGQFGLIGGLSSESAVVPKDICEHVKQEAAWLEANRSNIAKGSTPVENMLDELIATYYKTIYKLENLR